MLNDLYKKLRQFLIKAGFDRLDQLGALLTDILEGKYKTRMPAMRKSLMNEYEKHYSFRSFDEKLQQTLASGEKLINYYFPPDRHFHLFLND